MAKPPPPKAISHAAILDYILQFCVTMTGSDGRRIGSSVGFCVSGARPGDLIRLTSAPRTKWRLGWLVEIDTVSPGNSRYLIESLEDGSLCWWGNVGVEYLERDSLSPSWRWTDRQWEFKARWWRVCYRARDAYMVLPLIPVFGEGFEVTLGTRTRHGFDEARPSRSFPDWRKVTKAMLAQCYDDCVAEREAANAAARAEREAAE